MNILFVFSDQQRRDALGCMGNPNVLTPNLDALAERGVLFRRAYSADPICTPYRGSLFTGQYTSRCGVVGNCLPLPSGTTTLADAFNAGAYQTAFVGKWHLGGNGNGPIAEELRGGFQQFIGYQCYNGFHKDVCFYDETGEEHRFDRHRTEVTTDMAIERLERMAGAPFMMTVAYQAPHYPEQPSPECEALYLGRPIQHRPNMQEVDPFTATYSPPSPKPWELDLDNQRYGNNLDEYIRLYNAMCTQVDANVGRLLDALERLGLAEDTAVFYTSDHGDMQGDHGLKNKCLPHEGSAGVPLIVYVPGTPGGRIEDGLVVTPDFMPTCLDLAGLPPVDGVDGTNFAPLLRGEAQTLAGPAFSERDNDWCMILKGPWKLCAERRDGALVPTLMTHLIDDPYELQNRVEDEAVATVRRELLHELSAWNQSVAN